MATLYMASNYVDYTGNYGHLQFVFDPGNGSDFLEAEVQAPNITTIGNWSYHYGEPHNATNHYQETDLYFITAIVLKQEQDALNVWELIGQIVGSMSVTGAAIDYIGASILFTGQNSNSFVNTLSYVLGLTANWAGELAGGEIEYFPGYGTNVLLEAEIGSEVIDGIALQLNGTDGNDFIHTGNGNDTLGGAEGNDTILSGAGSDTVSGGAGSDSIYGGAGDDTLIDDVDVVAQDEGGGLYGGSGADMIDVSASVDASIVYGGSGNDTLLGNGASILYGGSGIDAFRIVTSSSVPSASGDTIVDAEADDTLWINGIEVTETSADIIFGIEVGGPGGGPWYLPRSQGGQGFEHGATATAPLGIVFRVTGLAEDFTGLRQDILVDMYIFTNVSLGPINSFGAPSSTEQFYLNQAVTVIRDVHLGDFGLFENGIPAAGGIHNSTYVSGRLVHDGIDYIYGDGLINGPPRTLSEEILEQEALTEHFREQFEDGPQLANVHITNAAGSSNDDFFIGDDAAGNFTGGAGNDQVFGGGGNDTVLAGLGADVGSGGDGADTLSGEDGDDILFGDASPITQFQSSAFEGADSISGGIGADHLYGNGGGDTLQGDIGNDRAFGGEGDDSIFGGVGDDSADGGAGWDLLQGDDGNDTLQGGADIDSVYGGNGDDEVRGGDGLDSVYGGAGNDSVIGGEGNDSVYGEDGSDTLLGAVGDDTLTGGAGNDSLEGGADEDSYTYTSGAGNDIIFDSGSYLDVDSITFTDIASTAVEFNRVNNDLVIQLGTGSNITIRNQYRVTNESVEFALFSDGITVNLRTVEVQTSLVGTQDDDFMFGINTTTSEVIEALGGNDSVSAYGGDDSVYGDDGNDTLLGGSGADFVYGGAGDDILDGGADADNLFGGAGNDLFVVTSLNDTVSENVGQGMDLVESSVSWVLGTSLENLTLTGTASLDGTGNDLDNLLVGNSPSTGLFPSGGMNKLYGLAGSDTLIGNAGNDTLDGGVGNDSLDGGTGIDSMVGGTGNDIFVVNVASDVVVELTSGGNDLVQALLTWTLGAELENLTLTGAAAINGTGNALDNALTGNAADNTLTGDAGNDRLDGSSGNDTLIGGVGNDTYVVDATTDTITEAAAGGTDLVQSSLTWTLAAELENLTLTGTAAINGTGNAAANVLTGNTGSNALYGGAGADRLNGGAGTDSLYGGADNDTYIVNVDTVSITEAAAGGIDLVQTYVKWTLGLELENLTLVGSAAINGTGNTVANILTGNAADNGLYGGAGNDTLSGGAGNDTLNGGTGTDSLTGGLGDDLYTVDVTTEVVLELAAGGYDTIESAVTYVMASEVEALVLTGTAAVNGTGNTLNNVITGNAAANFLSGGAGNDTITGGAGNDTLVVDATGDVLIEAAAGGTDLVQSSVAWTLSAEFENLALMGASGVSGTGNTLNNALTGNTAANALYGGSGNDTVNGEAGADTLNGGAGNDSLIGGADGDTYVVDVVTDVIVELAAGGTDLVQASLTWTLAAEIEELTLTGSAAINGTGNILANVLTGNTAANALYGGAANDTLSGGTGNDTLDGGTGVDSMAGGLGDDLFIVDATTDAITEAASSGADRVESSVTYTLSAALEDLTLTGTAIANGTGNLGANTLTGNGVSNVLTGLDGDDTLIGNSGDDTLIGGVGNDVLNGGGNSDSMTGGTGDDFYIVNSLADEVIEAAAQGTDLVQSNVNWTLGVNLENLQFYSNSALVGTGNTLANNLTGNIGSNALSGLDGNDTLIGGGGNDTLNGGTGADRFVFNSISSGVDVISDFNEVNGGAEEGDKLLFDGILVGSFTYRGASAFSGGSDNSEARVSGNQVLFDANGDGTADITITLTGLTAASQLAATDFVFV